MITNKHLKEILREIVGLIHMSGHSSNSKSDVYELIDAIPDDPKFTDRTPGWYMKEVDEYLAKQQTRTEDDNKQVE